MNFRKTNRDQWFWLVKNIWFSKWRTREMSTILKKNRSNQHMAIEIFIFTLRRDQFNLLFYRPNRPWFCQKEKNNNMDSPIAYLQFTFSLLLLKDSDLFSVIESGNRIWEFSYGDLKKNFQILVNYGLNLFFFEERYCRYMMNCFIFSVKLKILNYDFMVLLFKTQFLFLTLSLFTTY